MSNTHKQTLSLSRNNLILVCAQPVGDGWSLTVRQISFFHSCQETPVPALTENTFRTWRPHYSAALKNSNQPVTQSGRLIFPFAILFPITRTIKSGFACPFSCLLFCPSAHILGAGLLFWRGCFESSSCFIIDCYCTWNNTRTEVRWRGKQGAQNVTPLKTKSEEWELPSPSKNHAGVTACLEDNYLIL